MQNESIEAIGSDGDGLRLEFRWLGDRYGHSIARIKPGSAPLPLLESIEGAPQDDWPPSPPFQSLTLHKLPDGAAAALLVGMAGRCHWSASIEAVPSRAELIFDVACRHSDQPTYLGSQNQIFTAPEKTVAIHSTDSVIEQQAEKVSIQPQSLPPRAQTTRWKYVVRIEGTEK